MRRTVLPGFVYALASCAFTWPLARHPFALFGAADPTGDPSLNLWTLGWDLQTLSAHPAWLLTGRVFEAPIFFPAHHALAFSDHLLLQAIALWPIYALTHDLIFCYNLLLIASLTAAALAMHLLVRALMADERAAFVAGLIFGFAPYHFTHLTHIQLQALYFLPLSLLFLHRVFAAGRRADVIALGLVLGLQAVSSVYYGVIGIIGIACAAVVLAIATRRLFDARLLLRGGAAAAIALVVALPWSVPYLRVERESAAGRNLYETSRGSAVLASYLYAPSTNVLYGQTRWLQPTPRARIARKDGPEQPLFLGFVPMLLAVAGVAAAPRHLKRIAAVYAALTLLGVVLSLGPDGARPLYTALYRGLFGMEAIRAAARFSVLALCGVAVLAAAAVHAVNSRFPRLRPLTLIAVWTAIAIEYSNGAIPFPPAPSLSSGAGRWLRDQPGSGAAVCVPMGFDAANTRCMLQGLEHGRPIANGYGGLRPPFFPALVDAMSELPSPDSLLMLHDIGVEYVISDRLLAPDSAAGDALIERARFDNQRVYELAWSTAIESRIARAEAPVPAAPGPIPFTVGESATYRVQWIGGPLNLPAGEATISVAPPQREEAFRFVASAATAAWVSSFYDAIVGLETTTTARLLPLKHSETIATGGRRVDRQFEFDDEHREVHVTTAGATITMPLGREARDPISALFYVRTLPIQPGSRITLPLSDNGRRSQLEMSVDSAATVTIDGRAWPAWKLSSRITGRVERQEPLAISAWLSADTRRIPLLLEVTAAFGTVRAELASYRQGDTKP